MDKKMMNKLEDLVAFLKEEYEDKIDVNIIRLTGKDSYLNELRSHEFNQWNFPLPGGWNFPGNKINIY
jgi:hypothetical protein